MEYSTQYQTQFQKHNRKVEDRRQSEKTEQVITDERRHQETIKVANNSNKLTKYGTVIALIIAGISLIVAIFKP